MTTTTAAGACARCDRTWGHLHVTDILRRAGLINLEWVSEDALLRGTYVHQAIALGDALDWDTLDAPLVPYVRAYHDWKATVGAEVLASEVPVEYPSLGYAGTLDAIVRVNHRNYIVDAKSGGCPPSVGPQTMAYRMALNAFGPKDDRYTPVLYRAALQLRADGTYRWHVLDDRNDEPVFRAALTVAQWQLAKGL